MPASTTRLTGWGCDVARVRVTHTWPDGDALAVEVSVSESYPDAVAEARANAKALWSEVLGVTVDTLAAGEDDD